MHWDIDTKGLTAITFDADTGVTLECYPMDLNEGVSWRALDPDGDEFTLDFVSIYKPGVFDNLWDAIQEAETWFAEWLSDGEEGIMP